MSEPRLPTSNNLYYRLALALHFHRIKPPHLSPRAFLALLRTEDRRISALHYYRCLAASETARANSLQSQFPPPPKKKRKPPPPPLKPPFPSDPSLRPVIENLRILHLTHDPAIALDTAIKPLCLIASRLPKDAFRTVMTTVMQHVSSPEGAVSVVSALAPLVVTRTEEIVALLGGGTLPEVVDGMVFALGRAIGEMGFEGASDGGEEWCQKRWELEEIGWGVVRVLEMLWGRAGEGAKRGVVVGLKKALEMVEVGEIPIIVAEVVRIVGGLLFEE